MNRNYFLILLIGILLGVGAFFLLSNTNKNNVPSNSSQGITGQLNVNGVIPQNGSITILARDASNPKEKLAAFASGIPASDQTSWRFDGAQNGKSYEIQAVLYSGNQVVTSSDPIFVSAPATDEILTIDAVSTTSTDPATISGTIGLNGYIPSGSTINVEAKRVDQENYQIIAPDLPAKDNQFLTYTGAIAGREYDLRAVLYNSNGTEIGTSSTLAVVAPALNETFNINSTATPPVVPTATPAPTTPQATAPSATSVPTNSVISGSINFNGSALPNSRIVIFQRANGSSNYQVAVDNITPVNGVTWQWNGASAGAWYNMIAILKQKQSNGTDQDIALSSTLTMAAPAANEVFTINSGYSLPSPNGSVSVTCGSISGGTTWGATFSFPSMPNAQSYWLQIGVTNGGIELMNQTMNATGNQNQQVNANIQNGVTYFARYAYAVVPNLGAGSPQFSPFTSTAQLRCSQ